MHNDKVLQHLLIQCAGALFADYNRPLTYTGTRSSESQSFVLSGVIGFAGRDMRGMLLLAMTSELLEELSPSTAFMRDWIAELSNQLLGRFKNQLLRYGTEIYGTTPSVLRGELLTPLQPRGARRPLLRVGSGQGLCVARHRDPGWLRAPGTVRRSRRRGRGRGDLFD